MGQPPKRGRYDHLAAATAQFYNTTGTVPSNLHLPPDISYLITNQPSCTIVVAELPSGCQDHDIMGLFSRYGQIKNVKLVCNGRAALVEFCEISSPTRLVHMAKINPFCVGTNRVRLEFSSESIGLPVERRPLVQPQPQQQQAPSDSGPTKILHLDISAADYPITVDVIKAIASPHGKINRMFIGKKNVDRSLEALLEFNSIDEAKVAKEHLDGADIYSGCCSLTVGFSRLQRVHVTKNDTESWDFTGANANVEGPLSSAAGQRTLLGPAAGVATAIPQLSQTPTQISAPPILQAPGTAAQGVRMYSPVPPQGLMPVGPPPMSVGYYPPPAFVPPGSAYPPYQMGGYVAPPMNYSMFQGAPPAANGASQTCIVRPSITIQQQAPLVVLPTPAAVHHVTAGGIGIGHSTSNLSTAATSAKQCDMSLYECMEGVVLMVTGFPSHLNCDHLFNILCLYGNIARIKFLKTRSGCALVQVGTAEASDLIHRYYTGITVFGQSLQFYHSKQTELKELDNLGTLTDGSPVMKNYLTDPNNRFRNAVVAAKSRILEPSRTLHFFNAPLNIVPDEVCRVFTNCGAKAPPRVVIFSTKDGQKTSLGLAEWDTLADALEALILTNHRPIHISGVIHPFHLKLAFSPKPISDDRSGLSLIQYAAPPISIIVQPPVLVDSRQPLAEEIFDELEQQGKVAVNGRTAEDTDSKRPLNGTTDSSATVGET